MQASVGNLASRLVQSTAAPQSRTGGARRRRPPVLKVHGWWGLAHECAVWPIGCHQPRGKSRTSHSIAPGRALTASCTAKLRRSASTDAPVVVDGVSGGWCPFPSFSLSLSHCLSFSSLGRAALVKESPLPIMPACDHDMSGGGARDAGDGRETRRKTPRAYPLYHRGSSPPSDARCGASRGG